MSFVTTVMVGNAHNECARLGRAAMLDVVGSAVVCKHTEHAEGNDAECAYVIYHSG